MSKYPSLTVRLPRATKDLLVSISAHKRAPIWKLLVEAVNAYAAALPRDERRAVEQFIATMRKPQ